MRCSLVPLMVAAYDHHDKPLSDQLYLTCTYSVCQCMRTLKLVTEPSRRGALYCGVWPSRIMSTLTSKLVSDSVVMFVPVLSGTAARSLASALGTGAHSASDRAVAAPAGETKVDDGPISTERSALPPEYDIASGCRREVGQWQIYGVDPSLAAEDRRRSPQTVMWLTLPVTLAVST